MSEVKVYIRAIKADGEPSKLRQAMVAAGFSYKTLARAAGINHQHIANVAKGKGGMERDKADAIAQALGMPVGSLFSHGDKAPLAGA
jgi:transcriptional regulator with XRE-family HTH domain